MPKTFKISCKKANFQIDGKHLTITANQTYLKTHCLDDDTGKYYVKIDYFSHPEAARVANFIQKLGFNYTKQCIDGQEHYSFSSKNDIDHLILRGLLTIGIMHDLITKEEGCCFHNQFLQHKENASNVDNYCNFFTEKPNDSELDYLTAEVVNFK